MTRQTRVLSQHQDLNYSMDRITLLVNAPKGTLPEDRTKSIIEREFRDLNDNVVNHFSYEETDGYMADVLLQAPHLSAKIDGLLADHKAIRDRLSAIKALSYEDGPVDVFCAEIAEVMHLVRAHERAEHEVLQAFIVDDFGSGGT
ncbi:MAG: hypothetical protein ACI97A_000235 [Planctomycetota bacterium]|jgi:hypothetical protein